jgi:hypothetical protein
MTTADETDDDLQKASNFKPLECLNRKNTTNRNDIHQSTIDIISGIWSVFHHYHYHDHDQIHHPYTKQDHYLEGEQNNNDSNYDNRRGIVVADTKKSLQLFGYGY